MNFKVEKLEPKHINDVCDRKGLDHKAAGGLVKAYMAMAARGEGLAGVDPATGKAFYVAGISILWPGTAESFGYGGTNGDMRPYAGGITVLAKKTIEQWAEKYGLGRIQTMLPSDAPEPEHRWMRALGFERESVMQKFISGQDWARYVRIFEGD